MYIMFTEIINKIKINIWKTLSLYFPQTSRFAKNLWIYIGTFIQARPRSLH